jgi:hypothetical protein
MYKTLAVVITCLLALFAFACASAPSGNSTNTGTTSNLDPKNMPAGLNANPLPVNGTTPGIPDPKMVNVDINRPGATPIPGIDPKHITVTPNPNGTPTPGIPDTANIQKQMRQNSKQTIQSEMNTPPAGPVQRSEDMRQLQNKKKPQ